jgi:hypothetical protein
MSRSTNYLRVIPRDLFNEASLLKCYGQLALYLLDKGVPAETASFLEHTRGGFQVAQDENSGAIYVHNLPLLIGGRAFRLIRPLNSREPWPLYVEAFDDPDFDVIAVFNEDGTPSADFLKLLEG